MSNERNHGDLDEEALKAAHKALMTELFLACQPKWGDVFAFMDERPELLRAPMQAYLRSLNAVSPNLVEQANIHFPGKFWLFAKGKVRPDEPLYGFRVFEPGDADNPIAEAEHDDPSECIRLARSLSA